MDNKSQGIRAVREFVVVKPSCWNALFNFVPQVPGVDIDFCLASDVYTNTTIQ